MFLSRCVLLSILLCASLAEAGGVYARVLWFEPNARNPTPWQTLTLAHPGLDEDCSDFLRSLPKDVRTQLGPAGNLRATDDYERVCALGPAHVLLGAGPSEDRRTWMFLMDRGNARILRAFPLPKRVRAVWAKLDSPSQLLIAYNEPVADSAVPAENPVHVWFVNGKTGRILRTLTPASDAVATSDERTGIVVVQVGTEPPLELPPSGQRCDQISQRVARSKTRILVFQTCVMFE